MGQRSGFLCLLFLILLGSFCSEVLASSLMGPRSDTNLIDEQEPVKRHSDGIFTDLYSRERLRQQLVKYVRAVLAEMKRQERLKKAQKKRKKAQKATTDAPETATSENDEVPARPPEP
ncbi:hypothetical protein lerEdw1_006119 [Lerista edwardsae]|nr:hypothetical protein lerEdw1_006119 [Lerista edwardsae]